MKKQTLPEFYESLPKASAPKTEFINKIISRCGVTQQAVQRWLKKGGMPGSKEHCDVVAEIAGIAPEDLFPLYRNRFMSCKGHIDTGANP